jgi:hypothetical protein
MSSLGLSAQTNDAEKHKTILLGDIYIDTIYSKNVPTFPPNVSTNASVNAPVSLGNNLYQININAINIGHADIVLQYIEVNNKVKWMMYSLNIVSSIISTHPDFVVIADDSPIVIYPLSNDSSTASDVTLSGVGQVQ